jgi:hypothetical protein
LANPAEELFKQMRPAAWPIVVRCRTDMQRDKPRLKLNPNTESDNMINLSKGLRAILLSIVSASLLGACGGDDNFDDRTGLADPKARFVHAFPGGPAVSLQRNGVTEPAATNVDYKYGSQYYDIGTASTEFSLRVAATNGEVATAGFNPSRGHKYTLVALPALSGAELLVIDDPYNKSLASDDARLRVLNAALNAQTFDVYVTAPGADLSTATPRFTGVAYKHIAPDSGADSLEVEADTYRLRIAPAGSKTVIFDGTVFVPKNGDWLLVVLPDDASPLTTNAVRVLLVRSDDTNDATDELLNQP